MTAYKFTASGGRSRNGAGVWKVGEPRGVRAKALVPCEVGIHYCRPEHLAWWISDELYEFEDLTPDEAFEHEGSKMVTRRGVCVRRVEAWTPEVARELAFRVADRAVRVTAAGALRDAGLEAEADRLAALPPIDSKSSARAAEDAALAAWGAARASEGAAWAAWGAAQDAWGAARDAEYRWVSSQILELTGEKA